MISRILYKTRETKLAFSATEVPNKPCSTPKLSRRSSLDASGFKRSVSGEIESEKVTIPRKLPAGPRLFAECGFRIQSVLSVRERRPQGLIRARDPFRNRVLGWSMIFSENRYPLFRIMLLALRVPMPMAVAMAVHHAARRTGHLVGPAEVPAVAEYVGAIAAERPGSGRDRW
jgi:hypothetical protein